MVKTIRDYYQINQDLATSGQPNPEEFKAIAQAGYQVVINLATSKSTNALANEGVVVSDQGMIYLQIPVLWDAPQLADVKNFFKMLEAFVGQKIWVHCAKNMRVSCFIYLWKKHIQQLPEGQACYPMREIWQPTEVWQELIEQVDALYSQQ